MLIREPGFLLKIIEMNPLLFYVYLTYYIFGYIFCKNSSTKKNPEEEYYLNYEYDMSNNSYFKPDSLILPNPDSLDLKYTVQPSVVLEHSLEDNDLKDHNFIDNLMYVYYGSTKKNGGTYGSEIIVIGSVLSCAAQLMTIFWVILKKNVNGKKEMKSVFLHLMCSFCLSNLLFMLGIYATKSYTKCLIISLTLHYLHLLTAIWLFLYCLYIYHRISNSTIINMKYFHLCAYVSPIPFSLVSFLLAPHGYETKRYCFMSIEKGMVFNYMLPVSILIVLTTLYSLNGIRKLNMELSKLEFSSSAESLNAFRNELEISNKNPDNEDEDIASLRGTKICFKLLCAVQTTYDIVWFAAVLALENIRENNSMAIVYAVISSILNWYIFIKLKAFLPTITNNMTEMTDDDESEPDRTFSTNICLSRRGSSDSIPLLVNSESCTEMRILRQDSISTISS